MIQDFDLHSILTHSSSVTVRSGSSLTLSYPNETLFVQEAGDQNAISVNDIAQGQLGDCFFLSALGEIAMKDPGDISRMITANSDGTETVNLYQSAGGGPTHNNSSLGYELSSFHVDNKFSSAGVNNYNTKDYNKGTKEIWPQVMEEAYAEDLGGYNAFANGGLGVDAMETLTGHAATFQASSAVTLNELQTLSQSPSSIVTFDTQNTKGLSDKLIQDHAYMFAGLVNQNGTTYVKLLNPWGNTEPGLIQFSHVKADFAQINIGSA